MVSDHSPSLPTASSLAWGSGGFTWVSTGGQTSALKCASGDRPGMSVPPPDPGQGQLFVGRGTELGRTGWGPCTGLCKAPHGEDGCTSGGKTGQEAAGRVPSPRPHAPCSLLDF